MSRLTHLIFAMLFFSLPALGDDLGQAYQQYFDAVMAHPHLSKEEDQRLRDQYLKSAQNQAALQMHDDFVRADSQRAVRVAVPRSSVNSSPFQRPSAEQPPVEAIDGSNIPREIDFPGPQKSPSLPKK